MSLLQIKDISMSFGSVKALDGVNLEIDEGTVLGLVGDNGAGKSTLMKIVTGIYSTDVGSVLLNGVNLFDYSPAGRRLLGIEMIYQDWLYLLNKILHQIFFRKRTNKKVFGLDLDGLINKK